MSEIRVFDSRKSQSAPFIEAPISVGDQIFIDMIRYKICSIVISGKTAMVNLSIGNDISGNTITSKTITLEIK